MKDNILYYGDNLHILREHIKDESVDLIYLDPPFNSKSDYNILYKELSGEPSRAQITAFEDTWHWGEDAAITFQEIINIAPPNVVEMMLAFKKFIGLNDVMAYLTMMCIRLIELKRVLKNSGSIYLHCDPTASHYLKILMDTIFGKKTFRNEIVWHYTGWNKIMEDHFERRHDIILFYTKSDQPSFNSYAIPWKDKAEYVKVRKQKIRKDEMGKEYVLSDKGSGKRVERYLEDALLYGKPVDDVWEIDKLTSSAKERLGYPTQKPEALLERIINASSVKGDVVLDPFCGCGTTIAVSQRLKRNWIGIDVTHLAINLIKLRMNDMFNIKPKKDYIVIGEPEDIDGAMELASQNRYQFQWWSISLIEHARPYQDKKKGSDTGIDGIVYFEGDKKAIIQVKSGHVSVKDIRDLGHVIDREKAEIGIFITLEEPTAPMKKEALQKGFYKSKFFKKDYLKIQILTIKKLLDGKKPDIPLQVEILKKAKVVSEMENQEFEL
jgi:site-specific DNA-methyltransferase (adenine-specific)